MAHRSQMRGALQLATLLGQMLSVSGALYVLGALALVNHGHDGDDGDGQPWDAVWRALWVVGSPALILLLTVSVFETLVLQVDCLPPLVFVKFQAVKLLIMMVDAVAVGVLFYLHHDQTSLPDGWEYRVIAGWGFLIAVFGLGTLHAYFVYLECLKEMEAFDPIPVMISAASYGVYSQRDPRATIITVREPTETEALLAMSGPGPSRV